MAVCVWASPIPLHHPPCHGGQLSPVPLRCHKQIARSRAMRSAGSGPGPMSASVMGLFSMIHRDSVPCAIVQPWGMSRHPGDGCDEGCRWGWMLCLMGAGRAAEGGDGACCSSCAAGGRAVQCCLGELFCALSSWSSPAQRLSEPCAASWSPWAPSMQVGGVFQMLLP